MVFVDSNIPMYLVGESRPHKLRAAAALERLVGLDRRLVTSAEVLQEILHRYTHIGRPDAIQPAFDALTRVVDEVFAVEAADVQRAKDVLFGTPGLSSRDALHIAVMERRHVRELLSFDHGFDRWPGLTRHDD